MGEQSAIEWTEKTYNPWQGCTQVSAGCDLCYMFREKRRWGQDPEIVVRSKPHTFNAPLRWKEPAFVFTCSWSDWFHKAADAWRPEAWEIVRRTPHLTYQILTKRPGRIMRHLPEDWGEGYPNVWLGVSVEDQSVAHRIKQLLAVPARLRFLSCEPLIGPLSLREFPPFIAHMGAAAIECEHGFDACPTCDRGIDWVIAGGESGAGWRETKPEWLRTLRDECAEAHVPFFLKQLGGWPNKRGGDEALLDGVKHTAMPPLSVVA